MPYGRSLLENLSGFMGGGLPDPQTRDIMLGGKKRVRPIAEPERPKTLVGGMGAGPGRMVCPTCGGSGWVPTKTVPNIESGGLSGLLS